MSDEDDDKPVEILIKKSKKQLKKQRFVDTLPPDLREMYEEERKKVAIPMDPRFNPVYGSFHTTQLSFYTEKQDASVEKWRRIHFACKNGDFRKVESLIKHNCDIECEEEEKWRPIHFACYEGHLEIVQLLIKHNCYLECEIENKLRPIHFASSKGHLEIVQLLIKHNCDIECEIENKWRPIDVACSEGHLEIAQILIKHNCDIKCEEENKARPIHVACFEGHLEIVQLLIKHNWDIECEDKEKWRPIHVDCSEGHLEIVQLLIKHNCDIECEDENARRSVHMACFEGHLGIVEYLVGSGCNLECDTSLKMRPIHFACFQGHLNITKCLVDNGCQLEYKNLLGWQPIDFAFRHGHLEVIKLLLEYSSDSEYGIPTTVDATYVDGRNQRFDMAELLQNQYDEKKMKAIADKMGLACGKDCSHKEFCRKTFLSCEFEKKKEIGEGGFSCVYCLTESVTNNKFALKCIPDGNSNIVVRNIENCADILQHENIVRYFGAIYMEVKFFDDDPAKELNIFMEYMKDGSLDEYINNHCPMDQEKVARFTEQILEGVSYLHIVGIIHLDIKPKNILLNSEEQVKISDFGCSRFYTTLNSTSLNNIIMRDSDTKISKSSTEKFGMSSSRNYGTKGYQAPEIVKGESFNSSADIWSVGATVIQMLTGKCPDVPEFRKKIETNPFYDLVNEMVREKPAERGTAESLLNKIRHRGTIQKGEIFEAFKSHRKKFELVKLMYSWNSNNFDTILQF